MNVLSFTTDFTEVNALARRLGIDVSPAIEREMGVSMTRSVLRGQRQAVSTARHDTGDNRRRHTHAVEHVTGGVIGAIGTSAPHGPTVEFGRKPGSKMPPKGVLLGWMRRRNIDPKKEYVLRRAIARKGTKGDHNLQTTVTKMLPDVQREFAGIGPRVVQRALKGGR